MRIGIVALALAVAASIVPGGTAGREREAHPCVRGNELWFTAADGTRLVGHRFGTGPTAVILAHQSESDLCPWVPYARTLAAKGYLVFPFDFRSHGFSRAPKSWRALNRLPGDVAAATRALRARGARRVFLVGASMGGIASLVAAANIRPAVAGVVSLSSPADYRGMNGVRVVRRLAVPTLYVAAKDEGDGRFAADARRLYEETAAREKRLQVVPGELHGIDLLMASDEVRRLVESFLRAPQA